MLLKRSQKKSERYYDKKGFCDMWKYNKGEWSELYTFCYILKSGILYSADKDLNMIENIYFPVIKIIREEAENNAIDYYTGDTIKIYRGETLLKEVAKSEFEDIADELLLKIPEGKRAFEIPGMESFFNSVYCSKVKEASNKKQDITLQLHDIHTGIKPVCGFSIKSYLGSNPTLINPGENTHITFVIDGCNDTIMNEVNEINTHKKIIDKVSKLSEYGCSFVLPDHLASPQFEQNLQFIDTIMPKFIMYMVLYSYQYSLRNTSQVIEKMKELNPLGFNNVNMYTYKFKKLLCAWALGLTPERTDWDGSEDANGGYITVKHDGSVVCYHLYNRTEFEQYLFEYTYFEKPSTTKYKYFYIFKENGVYKIKMSLQVRFK